MKSKIRYKKILLLALYFFSVAAAYYLWQIFYGINAIYHKENTSEVSIATLASLAVGALGLSICVCFDAIPRLLMKLFVATTAVLGVFFLLISLLGMGGDGWGLIGLLAIFWYAVIGLLVTSVYIFIKKKGLVDVLSRTKHILAVLPFILLGTLTLINWSAFSSSPLACEDLYPISGNSAHDMSQSRLDQAECLFSRLERQEESARSTCEDLEGDFSVYVCEKYFDMQESEFGWVNCPQVPRYKGDETRHYIPPCTMYAN